MISLAARTVRFIMRAACLSATLFAATACTSTEPSAEERALGKVWVVHVDRPAAGTSFIVGTSEWLTATAFDSAGVPMTYPFNFHWESSDSTIISVEQNGRVTAKRAGTVWIHARLLNGIYGFYVLGATVPVTLAQSITVNPAFSVMLPAQRRTLVLQDRASPDTIAVTSWISSNPAVASVDGSGTVTAIAPGAATISVSYSDVTFTSALRVADEPVLRFTSVVTGYLNSCALTADGIAYCWGWTESGVLGTTDPADQCVSYGRVYDSSSPGGIWARGAAGCAMEPVRVRTSLRFASLDLQGSVGEGATACGTTTTGESHCWGNTLGLPGGAGRTEIIPVSSELRFRSFTFPCGVTPENDAWCFGSPAARGTPASASTSPSQVTGAGIWRMVTGGMSLVTHRCGVTTTDVVSCWGDNTGGKLGTGTTTASVVPVAVSSSERFSTVAVSQDESCALTLDQKWYCWGKGQLVPTLVSSTLRFTALSASSSGQCALGTDATMYCRNYAGALQAVAPGYSFRSISAGSDHHCGMLTDALVYCWGGNSLGQLGTGSQTDRSTPTLVIGQ